jgi:excisionase family DNA binding protein
MLEAMRRTYSKRNVKVKLLTTKQTADLLGVSYRTLEGLRLTGNGPAFIKVGRLVRYELATVEDWLLAHQRLSTSATSAPEIQQGGLS